MAKVYKIEFYITDLNDEYSREDIKAILNNEFSCSCFGCKESDEFEWEDDLQINYIDATQKDFENVMSGVIEKRLYK